MEWCWTSATETHRLLSEADHVVNFDGGCRDGWSSGAASVAVVKATASFIRLMCTGQFLRRGTNNTVECYALQLALNLVWKVAAHADLACVCR